LVSLRTKFFEWLSRGDPGDPNELVEVARVRIGRGPLTVEELCSAGFHATGDETFNIVTNTSSDYRVLVPRVEADRAMEHLKGIL
jgi:hypothetical protein